MSGILLLVDDQVDAESIAVEVRRKGHRVVVRPHSGHETLAVAPGPVGKT